MYPEILELQSNPELTGMAEILPDITYSVATGKELKLSIILPWRTEGDKRKYPLIVFIQGSAWTFPNIYYEIPQLSQWARQGYVVATITHRSALDGCAFPAYLRDTKTAIRFLRANAEKYAIDPSRVCAYGTSSGGNTALLVGVTGDSDEFKTGEYAEFSDAVSCVAECFGPTDMPNMLDPNAKPDGGSGDIFTGLLGDMDPEHVLRRMSPIYYVEKGAKYPPFLLLHGDSDPVVPYKQGVDMFRKLIDCGADARLVRVLGAPHEGSFWSQRLIDEVFEFIKTHI